MALNPIEASLLPPDNEILTVSGFNRQVRGLLENRFPEVWLRGEISNFRRQSSGHCYFSLKDEKSQVSCVIFRGDAASLPLQLTDGLQIIAFGEVSVYEPRGVYQLIVRFLLEDGFGRLQLEFERLKKKLAGEGLFAPERKQPIPALPRTVGIVTSPTGAALRDFVSILERRSWRGRVAVIPSRVQGAEAAGEMVEGIELAERSGEIDLLVLARGGGSIEDLWPFNEERVARAVAACTIPTISAVGHEIDFTLSDFIADRRAETPSAAAELISSGFLDTIDRLVSAGESIDTEATGFFERSLNRIRLLANDVDRHAPKGKVEQGFLRIDDLGNRLQAVARHRFSDLEHRLKDASLRIAATSPEAAVRLARARYESFDGRLGRAAKSAMEMRREHLYQTGRRMESVSPESILKRGFVLVKNEAGKPVGRKSGIKAGDLLTNQFADGEVRVSVTEG